MLLPVAGLLVTSINALTPFLPPTFTAFVLVCTGSTHTTRISMGLLPNYLNLKSIRKILVPLRHC